jgi:hypothetical protein
MRTWNPNGREKERGEGMRGEFFLVSFPPYLIHLCFLFSVVAMIFFSNFWPLCKKKKSDAKLANHHHHGPHPPLLF